MPDDAAGECINADDEQDPSQRSQRSGCTSSARSGTPDKLLLAVPMKSLKVALREHEERCADDGAVHGAHAADHDHQQDVDHDRERQRGVRAVVAQPERQQRTPAMVAASAEITDAAVR